MSAFAAFRRQPVPQQVAQNLQTITIPAPNRGIIQNENESFMTPGGANVQINWAPTMKGVKLRGGYERWCVLPETTPVISAFEYANGNVQRMYAGNATKLYDITTNIPSLIKSGQSSGNYVAAQLNNTGGNYMVVVNDAGDFILRTSDGIGFAVLSGVAGPAGDGVTNITYDPTKLPAGVAQGRGLVYVWKYRNRLYFIQQNSMNAWYLPIDAAGGVLQPIYLSGAAAKGGKLLFLGFGTGLGTAMIVDGVVVPMELAHLPYKKKTFEDYVGERALERDRLKKWRKHVADVIARLVAALEPEDVVLGGGNAVHIKQLPPKARLGANTNAFPGGFRLWADGVPAKPAKRASRKAAKRGRKTTRK